MAILNVSKVYRLFMQYGGLSLGRFDSMAIDIIIDIYR